MRNEVALAIYDAVIPEWRDAHLRNGNRRVRAPYRDDEHASLDIHEEKLTWYDRGIGEGGGAFDLAVRVLGNEDARSLMRQLGDGVVTSEKMTIPEAKRRLTELRKIARKARMTGLAMVTGRALKDIDRELGAIRDALPKCQCAKGDGA